MPATEELPPVLLVDLKDIQTRTFYDILELHHDRNCSNDHSPLKSHEVEFKDFKRVIHLHKQPFDSNAGKLQVD